MLGQEDYNTIYAHTSLLKYGTIPTVELVDDDQKEQGTIPTVELVDEDKQEEEQKEAKRSEIPRLTEVLNEAMLATLKKRRSTHEHLKQ